MEYTLPDSPKMLREALCVAQGAVSRTVFDSNHRQHTLDVLQRLIDECDRHRPLGVNGKHSNLHTDTCGCEDKGPRQTWATVQTVIHAFYFHLHTGEKATVCGMKVPEWTLGKTPEDVTCWLCKEILIERGVSFDGRMETG